MKKTHQFTCILLATIFIFSCRKPNNESSNPPTINTLLHKWSIDSVVVYDNRNFTGTPILWNGVTGFLDYRTDNKIYTRFDGIITADNPYRIDTASYSFQLDNNLIISNRIRSGITSTLNDTTKVILLKDHNLIVEELTIDPFKTYHKIYCHQ